MKYMLNNLGINWIWEADSKEEATELFCKEFRGSDFTLEEYQQYCKNVGISSELTWKEVQE